MTTESMVTQADFEAIMDRLEKGPMNLTGKSWRDTPDDPAVAELREHFILPVIEEYVARRTAAQPEREAVLEEAARVADRIATQRRHAQRGNFGNRTCADEAEGASAVAIAIRALKTTPAPAASQPEREAVAWRWRYKGEGDHPWILGSADPHYPGDSWETQPLYTALTTPAPAAESDWFAGDVDCDGNELVTIRADELQKLRDEREKFMWQVRDTCTRAEKAEAALAAASAVSTTDLEQRLRRTRTERLMRPAFGGIMLDMEEERQAPINPDGPEAADEIARLRAENERLAKALDPFARAAAIQPPGAENWPDDKPNPEFLPKLWPDWGDFRRARTALKGSRHE